MTSDMVKCPECEDGQVWAAFTYSNGDTTDVRAECPYCGGAGKVLASAVPRV